MITLMRCIEVLLLLLACLFQRLKKIIWLLSGKVCCTPAPNSFFAFSWSFKAVGRENRTLPGIFVLCVCTSVLRGCCRLFPWLPLWPMSDWLRSNTRAPFLRLDYNVPHVCSSTPLAPSFQKKKKDPIALAVPVTYRKKKLIGALLAALWMPAT